MEPPPQVLRPEALLPLLSDPGMLARLAPHLPEQHRSQEALMSLAHSPQFQQQLQVGRRGRRMWLPPCSAVGAAGSRPIAWQGAHWAAKQPAGHRHNCWAGGREQL
jgi:hypothetical protein